MPKQRQTAYLVTHTFKGHNFHFFRDRGCIISKNLRKDYADANGTQVIQDFDFEDVKNYFVKEKDMEAIDIHDKTKNKTIVQKAAEMLNIEAKEDRKMARGN